LHTSHFETDLRTGLCFLGLFYAQLDALFSGWETFKKNRGLQLYQKSKAAHRLGVGQSILLVSDGHGGADEAEAGPEQDDVDAGDLEDGVDEVFLAHLSVRSRVF
jgi:hypothetical protein